ncbi:MAG TPA: ATP-binding protein [Ignavibacteria bacterium]|nr:ATP-binding protein [Ignavibacteria bacterium]
MEYIDNSIDAASLRINPLTHKTIYQNDAEIIINIRGSNYAGGSITITDNCKGIFKLIDILQNIGFSNKKSQSWTNGNFGFGIYSFMAVCNRLDIITKFKGKNFAEKVTVTRNDFEKKSISDVNLNITTVRADFAEHYTEVTLSGFDKEKWEDFRDLYLGIFISHHFDLILRESPLKIKLLRNNKQTQCRPYMYGIHQGSEFTKEFTVKIGKGSNTIIKKAKIFLKYTSQRITKRPIAFFSKGRRINDVNQISLFDSNNKTLIWSNPQLTGYIDTADILSPVITRNTYKNDIDTKRFFTQLKKLEPVIIDFINICNQKNITTHFNRLEDIINEKIKCSIKNKQKIKRKPQSGDIVTINEDDKGYEIECIQFELIEKATPDQRRLKRTSRRVKANPLRSNIISADSYKYETLVVNPVQDEISSIKIKIEGNAQPLNDENNTALLSILVNNKVVIYKKHKDFNERVRRNRLGEEFMTKSLISLIIIEFLSHYLKQINSKNEMNEFKEVYYELERELEELNDKPLTTYLGA